MKIRSYCRITSSSIVVNGVRQHALETVMQGKNVGESLDSVFQAMGTEYPHFYDMDDISKFVLLTAELVLRNVPVDLTTPKPDTTIILHTRSGNLYTDFEYQKFLAANKREEASKLFLYTFPSSICNEIAIRNQIQGEYAVLAWEGFYVRAFANAIHHAFAYDTTIQHILVGYFEKFGGYASSLLCYINREDFFEHSDSEIWKDEVANAFLQIY